MLLHQKLKKYYIHHTFHDKDLHEIKTGQYD